MTYTLKKANSSVQGKSKKDNEDKFGSPLGFIIQNLEI
jgi:hypothetical protein